MGQISALGALAGREKAELDNVLSSAAFSRSPRLAHLLQYLCTKYFDGEADQIKEYNIAVDVLNRPETFDPAEDAIARVEVHRLRKKLKEYYETEGTDHPLRIVIPTGRYGPIFLTAAQVVGDHELSPPADAEPVVPVEWTRGYPARRNTDPPPKASPLSQNRLIGFVRDLHVGGVVDPVMANSWFTRR